MAEYESLQNLAHFGTELSPEIQKKLKKGSRLNEIFDQDYNTVVDETSQLILLGIVWGAMFEEMDVCEIQKKLALKCSTLIDICKPEKIQFFETLDDLVADLQAQKAHLEKILL